MRRTPTAVLTLGAAAAVLVACGSSGGGSGGASASGGSKQAVKVQLTNSGCTLDKASIPTGPVTFKVSNANSSAVTEAELMKGEVIQGERENIAPGLSASFSLNLKPGEYAMKCPGGSGPEKVKFTVTGQTATGTVNAQDQAQLKAATDGYATYVKDQVNQLVTNTQAFVTAVQADDLTKAAALYPASRANYERIEPVAESFGNLDPELDARIADVTSPAQWTGFHRLEKAIFQDKSLNGMGPIADKLLADTQKLQKLVATTTYQPAQLANGATELLDEIGKTKVTGEEEAYSHLDLLDFQANIDGAQQAFDLLRPVVAAHQPALATNVTTQFTAMDTALKPYKRGTGWENYSQVDTTQRRALSQQVDALAEPLSQVAGVVVG